MISEEPFVIFRRFKHASLNYRLITEGEQGSYYYLYVTKPRLSEVQPRA